MNKLLRLLAKPFPQEESFAESLAIILAISFFVVFFLFVFQPFGIHQMESGLFLLCLGFGVVTFVTTLAYELLVVKVLKFKGNGSQFTYGRWILYFLGAMFFISLGNFLFVRLSLIGHIDWRLFPYMIRGTLSIGFFPIVVIGALALLKQEKKYQRIADVYNQSVTPSEGPHEQPETELFGIPTAQINFIEGMQNYVKISHSNASAKTTVQTERATLKSVAKMLENSVITQCHRSFFVNKERISSIAGNAQGLLLSLEHCDKQIPVSRRYIAKFKDHGART